MIDPKELRIGNFVYLDKTKELLQISQYELCACIEESFNPITLTEEWLVMFGFDSYGHIYAKELSNGLSINYNIPHKSWFVSIHATTTSTLKLNHVHQLQNLYFALTSKELIIEDVSNLKE